MYNFCVFLLFDHYLLYKPALYWSKKTQKPLNNKPIKMITEHLIRRTNHKMHGDHHNLKSHLTAHRSCLFVVLINPATVSYAAQWASSPRFRSALVVPDQFSERWQWVCSCLEKVGPFMFPTECSCTCFLVVVCVILVKVCCYYEGLMPLLCWCPEEFLMI